ncbi:hypothetical protein FIT84_04095 [Candidatus Methylopumilus universalis]|nr:hypothetical protein FIT84_04095 [Candidatus Methylopumilus universalis]
MLIRSYRKLKISTHGSYIWGASLGAWIVTCGVGLVNSTFHLEHAILALLFLGLHLSFIKYQTSNRAKYSESHKTVATQPKKLIRYIP